MRQAKIKQFQIWYENEAEYRQLVREIFNEGSYFVELDKNEPMIIDAGAHIGLTTIYFKSLYPNARIIAIEPNPENIVLLKKNIFENQLKGVEVVETAIAEMEGEEDLYINKAENWYSTGGFYRNRGEETIKIKVKTEKLSKLVTGEVDLLKLDIEGAEERALTGAGEALAAIKLIMMEYHPKSRNGLKMMAEYLEDKGFLIQIWQKGREVKADKARGMVLLEARNKKLIG